MSDAPAPSQRRPGVAAAEFDRLLGVAVPQLRLESTAGRTVLSDLAAGRLVLFIYPHATGLPVPPVPGWDSIPGARGCTVQSCGFRDHYERLTELETEVVGLS